MGGPYGLVGAVVVAAGRSTRMGGVDKLFAPLGKWPLLAYPLKVLEESPLVDMVVLVLGHHNLEAGKALVADLGLRKVRHTCLGGERRQDSVQSGLGYLPPCQWVLVHDGARPFLLEELIASALEAAQETGAAVPALPIPDTVKEVEGDLVVHTHDRHRLYIVQTPQAFAYQLLVEAHRQVKGDVTDDASMVEAMGHKVRVFPGHPWNLKVTTEHDLALARALLACGGLAGDSTYRPGI